MYRGILRRPNTSLPCSPSFTIVAGTTICHMGCEQAATWQCLPIVVRRWLGRHIRKKFEFVESRSECRTGAFLTKAQQHVKIKWKNLFSICRFLRRRRSGKLFRERKGKSRNREALLDELRSVWLRVCAPHFKTGVTFVLGNVCRKHSQWDLGVEHDLVWYWIENYGTVIGRRKYSVIRWKTEDFRPRPWLGFPFGSAPNTPVFYKIYRADLFTG